MGGSSMRIRAGMRGVAEISTLKSEGLAALGGCNHYVLQLISAAHNFLMSFTAVGRAKS
jgi:hypothetical protein